MQFLVLMKSCQWLCGTQQTSSRTLVVYDPLFPLEPSLPPSPAPLLLRGEDFRQLGDILTSEEFLPGWLAFPLDSKYTHMARRPVRQS